MAECHPVAFRWVMEAKNRGATVIHVDPRFTRTSAVADLHVPIRPGLRHRLPRRAGPLRHRARALFPRLRRPLHERRHPHRRAIPGRGGARRPLQRSKSRDRQVRLGHLVVRGRARHHPGDRPQAARGRAERGGRRGRAVGREDALAPTRTRRCSTRGASSSSSSGTSPATRRRWWRRPAGSRERSSCKSPRRSARTPGASGPAPSATRSAGRSTPSASSTSAPPPSCSSCSATSAGPAAGSWRSAATRRSRARPTSRRSSTSCRATCRCRTRSCPTAASTQYVTEQRLARRAGGASFRSTSSRSSRRGSATPRRRTTTSCFDTLPRLTGDHSHMATVADMADGKVKGYFVIGENPAVGSMHGSLHRKAMREARLARRPGLRSPPRRRSSGASAPRYEPGRGPARGHPDRGVLLPGRRRTPRRAGRSPTRSGCCSGTRRRSSRPATAAAISGSPTTSGSRLQALYAGSSLERDRPVQATHLGLRRPRPARRAVRRGGPLGGERLHAAEGRAGARVRGAEGRRLDRLRLLDLLGLLQGRREPDRAPEVRARADLGRAGVGLGLADEPAAALQPRLGGPGRQAVVGSEEVRLVGRAAAQVGGARRARLHPRSTAVVPAGEGRPRHRDHRRDRSVHHAGGREGLALRAVGAPRRAVPHALRAGGVVEREPALRAAVQSRPGSSGTAATTPPTAPSRIRASRTCSRRTASPSTTPRAG